MTGVICFLLGLFVGAVIGMALPAQDDATEERTQISVIEIWCECFRSPITRITRRDSYDIAAMLMRLGWVRSGQRRYIADYGRQRVFVKQTR